MEGEPCPIARSLHDAACVGYDGDHPHLLVTGGVDKDETILSDLWLLDIQSGRWMEVRVYMYSITTHVHVLCAGQRATPPAKVLVQCYGHQSWSRTDRGHPIWWEY